MVRASLGNCSQQGPECPWAQLYLKGSFKEEEASGLRTVFFFFFEYNCYTPLCYRQNRLGKTASFYSSFVPCTSTPLQTDTHTRKHGLNREHYCLGSALATMQRRPVTHVAQGPSAVTGAISLPRRAPEQWFCPPSLRLCFLFPLGSLGKETLGIPIPECAENISVKSPARREQSPRADQQLAFSQIITAPGAWRQHVHLLFLHLERLESDRLSWEGGAGRLTNIPHCCLRLWAPAALQLWAPGSCPHGTLRIVRFSTITWSDRLSLVLRFPRTKGPGVSLVNQWLYFNSGKVFNPSSGKHSKLVANGYHHRKNTSLFFF